MLLPSLVLLLAGADAAPRPTAATWNERLLVADGTGTVRAWSAKDLEYDAALTKKLNGDGLVAIERSGGVLWGFDGTRVFTWDDAGAQWDLVKSKPPRAPCSAFAVVNGAPVGTCGPGVHSFLDGKYWEAPEFEDQVKGRGFGERPHALASHGAFLAIGTGFGEWGGHLWLLDVSTGAWSKHYDSLGNAVGIAWTPSGWAVAWSMSHFDATTRVRLHGADGKPAREGNRLRGRYLRALAWDDAAAALYGLEQQQLVRVTKDLAFEPVQSIGKVSYGPERHAVGVSPGIAAFLALGGERFLLVPLTGEALVLDHGKVKPLRAPPPLTPDAGAPKR
ncbi:MAG: hypothetical protein AB1938_29895 [Myxococcota bacterium]